MDKLNSYKKFALHMKLLLYELFLDVPSETLIYDVFFNQIVNVTEDVYLSRQMSSWNSSACSVSGGELYIPTSPAEEDRINDLFYQHQVNAAWVNVRSEYGPRWINGSSYGRMSHPFIFFYFDTRLLVN